jgi:hypothetical protein
MKNHIKIPRTKFQEPKKRTKNQKSRTKKKNQEPNKEPKNRSKNFKYLNLFGSSYLLFVWFLLFVFWDFTLLFAI